LRRQLYPILRQYMVTHHQSGVVQCLIKPAARSVAIGTVRAELETLLAKATKAR
jgi:hypothetical protein